jgi:GDP-D-mannose dehydratase
VPRALITGSTGQDGSCWPERPSSKARERLGWTPKVKLKELARMMMEADLALVRDDPEGIRGTARHRPADRRTND